ncbi:ribosomal protein S5 domain 2-like protein [Microstroma glucosiphilum]|uniref:Ribosomal protein S5 domain 2-like protein n=1 Tax=Pseudomicrostroma glucosiphilum TaxID=1684307 RepID=A0A316U608_9BASI|nr:ribosomal protein S5 domain 2-like protein [Pseudomicrostroma glucosiphilum]PWN20268.1 ribosomal protein S5 domain 2-like protein [Pseudomicrostroma glucosiphilum]
MLVDDLIAQLSAAACTSDAEESTSYQELADELLALQSIYALDDPAALKVVSLYASSAESQNGQEKQSLQKWQPSCKVRLALDLPLDLPNVPSGSSSSAPPTSLRLSITLPPSYPSSSSAPQLQLLDRFIGDYEVDASLFGQVLRTFFHHSDGPSVGGREGAGVQWQSGEVVLFEGCESVKERVEKWYKQQKKREEERRKKDGRGAVGAVVSSGGGSETSPTVISQDEEGKPRPAVSRPKTGSSVADAELQRLISSKKWTSTAPLLERKSTFIGHAIRLDRAEEVPLLLQSLLDLYPRMEKATHPLMRAWACTESGEATGGGNHEKGRKVVHRDCDDDGESAAGGRLAHLLEMLHLDNALVVVTRYYGGIHLGADRFKLINRVARDALEAAGLLSQSGAKGSAG